MTRRRFKTLLRRWRRRCLLRSRELITRFPRVDQTFLRPRGGLGLYVTAWRDALATRVDGTRSNVIGSVVLIVVSVAQVSILATPTMLTFVWSRRDTPPLPSA